jgi:hypothetical protein
VVRVWVWALLLTVYAAEALHLLASWGLCASPAAAAAALLAVVYALCSAALLAVEQQPLLLEPCRHH